MLRELAEEITDPVRERRSVAVWRRRALAVLNRLTGSDSAWSREFEALADDLVLPAPSLAEDWDVHEFEARFHRATGVLMAAADDVQSRHHEADTHLSYEEEEALLLSGYRVQRTAEEQDGVISDEASVHRPRADEASERAEDGLTHQEVMRLVNRYIGVRGGYLGDFSFQTHADFYPEYCDLQINPYDFDGTTRQRFIEILSTRTARDQARVVRGVLERFPVDQADAPPTRTQDYRDELLRTISRLESAAPGVDVWTTTQTVRQALDDAEILLRSSGAASAVDRTHTALHGYLQNVAATAGLVYRPDASMTALLKLLRCSHPKLVSVGPRGQDIEKILNACGAILDAMLPVRNQASLAHPNDDLLGENEALLVISVGRSLLTYLDARLRQSAT